MAHSPSSTASPSSPAPPAPSSWAADSSIACEDAAMRSNQYQHNAPGNSRYLPHDRPTGQLWLKAGHDVERGIAAVLSERNLRLQLSTNRWGGRQCDLASLPRRSAVEYEFGQYHRAQRHDPGSE